MHIDVRDTGGVLTLHPSERITVETEKEFTSTVRGLLDIGHVRLVLDLADVPYMDSIAFLLGISREEIDAADAEDAEFSG